MLKTVILKSMLAAASVGAVIGAASMAQATPHTP